MISSHGITAERWKDVTIIGKGKPLPVSCAGPASMTCETYPCERCGKAAVILIHSASARLHDVLESLEPAISPLIQEMNIPTWILGPERLVMINGRPEGLAAAMQIWPTRKRRQSVLASHFNTMTAENTSKHCRAERS